MITPGDIERELVRIKGLIHESPRVIQQYEEGAREAKRVYDRACAVAFLGATEKTERAKQAQVTLETEEVRKDYEQADVLYEFAKRTARALERELDATQSISVSVRQSMAAS